MAKKYQTEAQIEAAGERRLKALGCKTRKMNGMGFRSWPDRQVFPEATSEPRPYGSFWIEWKRPGEKLTVAQKFLIKGLIHKHQQLVFVCRAPDDARKAWEHWRDGKMFQGWEDELE